MKTVRLAFTLFTIFFFHFAEAQYRVSGKVSDNGDSAITSAAVELKSGEKVLSVIQTDSTGFFNFPAIPPGDYRLRITHITHQSFDTTFHLKEDLDVTIHLAPAGEQLKSVTVTGAKPVIEKSTEKIVYNLSGSVTATGSDALVSIGQIPGIRINNNEISIAGKGITRVAVNNRLLPLEGLELIRYLKSISANQVVSIEMISNPSARYEVEGNAGLINIVLRRNKSQGYSGNLQVASKYYAPGESSVYGSRTFGEISGNAAISYNDDRWSLFASINHVRDRHLEGFRFDLVYPDHTWSQSDTGLYTHNAVMAMVGADYKLSSSVTIGGSYSGGRDMYDGSDHVRNPVMNVSGKTDSLLTTYAIYHPVALPAALNIHADIKLDTAGRILFLNADYFNYYRTDISDFENLSFDDEGNRKASAPVRIFDTNKQNIIVYTAKGDMEWPTTFAKYTFGAKVSFISTYSNAFYYDRLQSGALEYNTNLSNEFNYTENTQSVYASMNKEIGKWNGQLGVRGEYTQIKGYSYTTHSESKSDYFKLFPSLTVNYSWDANNQLSLALGRRINRPTFWSLNPFKSLFTANSYGEGNPYLQPEYTNHLEVSHIYKNIFTTSLFVNRTQNGFVNVTIAAPDTNLVFTRPLNFIRTVRSGISETISVKPFDWWEHSGMVSLYYTDASSALREIESVSGFGAYVGANNQFFLNARKTFAAAVNFWYQFPEIDHIGKTEGYYKLDAGIKVSSSNKKWDAALNLNDLFRSSAMRYSYTVNGVSQTFTNFQFNRYYQLSVSCRFGGNGAERSRAAGNEEETGRVH